MLVVDAVPDEEAAAVVATGVVLDPDDAAGALELCEAPEDELDDELELEDEPDELDVVFDPEPFDAPSGSVYC